MKFNIGVFILICLFIIYFLWAELGDYLMRIEQFTRLRGTFQLVMANSDLADYKSDSNLYRDLRLVINEDKSFEFNTEVSFIGKRTGYLRLRGGFEEPNQLCFSENDCIDIGTEVKEHDTLLMIRFSDFYGFPGSGVLCFKKLRE